MVQDSIVEKSLLKTLAQMTGSCLLLWYDFLAREGRVAIFANLGVHKKLHSWAMG